MLSYQTTDDTIFIGHFVTALYWIQSCAMFAEDGKTDLSTSAIIVSQGKAYDSSRNYTMIDTFSFCVACDSRIVFFREDQNLLHVRIINILIADFR